MLSIDKHTNPSLTIIYISSIILEELKANSILEYNNLLEIILRKTSANAKEIFIYALAFLYLLGKVEYLDKIDSLRLTNENI